MFSFIIVVQKKGHGIMNKFISCKKFKEPNIRDSECIKKNSEKNVKNIIVKNCFKKYIYTVSK